MALQPRSLFRVKNVACIPPGTYRDMNGKVFDATEEKLQELFGTYDPAKHQAQMKLGHGDDGAVGTPGFVERAYYADGYGRVDLITDEAGVQAILRTGTHPRRSIETIGLDGRMYLGDVAFMGNQRPAVKGLPHIQPSQVEPVSEADVLAFAEHFDRATSDLPTGLLLAEPDAPQAEELNMTDEIKLAEENARLAEQKAADLERQLAEYKEREAQTKAELRLAECRTQNLKFAETQKEKLGAVETGELAEVLAVADQSGASVKLGDATMTLGAAIRDLIAKMPSGAPPVDEVDLGEAPDKPDDTTLTAEEIQLAEQIYPRGSKELQAHMDVMLAQKKRNKQEAR